MCLFHVDMWRLYLYYFTYKYSTLPLTVQIRGSIDNLYILHEQSPVSVIYILTLNASERKE